MLVYSVSSSRSNLINALSILSSPKPSQPHLPITQTTISPTLQRRRSNSPGILYCFSLTPHTNSNMSAINYLYGVIVAIICFLFAYLTDLLWRFVNRRLDRHFERHLRRVARAWFPSWEEFLLGSANDRMGADGRNEQPAAPPRHHARQPAHAARAPQNRRHGLSRADRELAEQQGDLIIGWNVPVTRSKVGNA